MLRATLEYAGYTCEIAATAASALGRFPSSTPDAVIADLGLSNRDGADLVSLIRGSSDVPVIVISGRCAEADKIAALDRGADDYIEKPFLPGELVARVRAKMRRYATSRHEAPASPQQVPRESEVGLSPIERALVALLVQHRGDTVPEDRIITAIWGSQGRATSANLRTLVLKVRRKLEVQRQPLFVLNDPGVGYYVSLDEDLAPQYRHWQTEARGIPEARIQLLSGAEQ